MPTQYVDPATQQDQLRPVRQFISLLSGFTGDQNYANEDLYAVNTPGQFYVTTPAGTSVEGKPVSNGPGGGLQLSPGLIALGLVAAYLILK